MQTTHDMIIGNSQHLKIEKEAHLIVTSPPYPMIPMWDEMFGSQSYKEQHSILNEIWKECYRVLCPGGILCINVGDACRTTDGRFEYFPNHATIMEFCRSINFICLPPIHWRKPTNKPNKFMGSGMLPPNAYVTLEEENILIFKKPGKREALNRYESAYFWHERNQWFQDTWHIVGAKQQSEIRNCAAVFPIEVPLRLINMFSCYQDLVIDPFVGTGTTLLAAALTGRNSCGYETVADMEKIFAKRFVHLPTMSDEYIKKRLDEQKKSVAGRDTKYKSKHYDISVITKQEKDILFYKITDCNEKTINYELYNEKNQGISSR